MAQFAAKAHDGQLRKYGDNIPYITHPLRVASMIILHPSANENIVCAAIGHDLCEDTKTTSAQLIHEFGYDVFNMVWWLTNPSKKHPELKRAARKEMDRNHLKDAPRAAKLIKLADRLDNLRDFKTSLSHLLNKENLRYYQTLEEPKYDCEYYNLESFYKLYKEESHKLLLVSLPELHTELMYNDIMTLVMEGK